jgi:hypothetical protein
MLGENEFLGPHGIRSRSRHHLDHPFVFHVGGEEYKVQYLPGESRVLFDRFHRCDMAAKVVGVGSVGTVCLIALFMAADDDPLFLQIKQAKTSTMPIRPSVITRRS